MRIKPNLLRGAAVGFTTALLASAGLALAQADPATDGSVAISVEIAETTEPGYLALSLAGSTVALTETTSADPTQRQFSGVLPAVTVTDTRSEADISASAAWYVVGQVGAFADGANTIAADQLGWTPALADGYDDADGLVAPGDPVGTALDDPAGAGLASSQLLFSTGDSALALASGQTQWSANAGLVLRTADTVTAGDYAATLTLSLFE
ncbi:MAG: hypothetical protein LBK54_01035 [Propionibacteriaceae bacterium]|jgi:hypothetical protein|nr:hypothetical protein [Propionibacteriaceae bacterium]